MKKTFCSLLPVMGAAAAAMVTLNGCSLLNAPNTVPQESSEQSSLQQSEAQSSSTPSLIIEAPPAEMKEAGVITVYKASSGTEIFEPTKVSTEKADLTLLDIIKAAEKAFNVELPVLSVSQQKGMVVVNFAAGLVDSYPADKLKLILDTVGMTLKENQQSFEWLQYQVEGSTEQFGEEYKLPVLKLVNDSPDEFAAVRAKVPYEGLIKQMDITDYDETGNQIARFLSMLEPLDKDIASVSELDNEYILSTAINHTKSYTTDAVYTEEGLFFADLKPIEGPISEKLGFVETWFLLKEHVEQSAKLIFGEDVTVTHKAVNNEPYKYFEDEGVYTPPHRGAGWDVRPYLVDYIDMGDSYKVTTVYVLGTMAGPLDPDTHEVIPKETLQDYIKTKSRPREIVLRKAEDGTLRFVSHRFLPQ